MSTLSSTYFHNTSPLDTTLRGLTYVVSASRVLISANKNSDLLASGNLQGGAKRQ